MEKTKKKSKKIWIILVIVVMILAGGGIGAYFYFTPKVVNLNDYVSVQFFGYDIIGTAEVKYDTQKLKTDLGKENDENIPKVFETSGATLDRVDRLSNGDTLQLTYFYDNAVAYDSRIKFICTDETVTVEGLEEPEKLDPFADLKFKYEGTGPYAKLTIMKNNSKNDLIKNLEFRVSPVRMLSRGDKIKVEVMNYNERDFIEKNKAVLTATETEVEVPPLDQYITGLNQLTSDNQAELADITTRLGTDQYFHSNSIRPYVKMSNRHQIGTYLLVRKDLENAVNSFKNKYYAVYEMTVKAKKKNKKKKPMFKTQTLYQPVELINLYVSKKGEMRDFAYSRMVTKQYTICGTTKIKYDGLTPLAGYTSLDELKKGLITSQKDYDCEKEGELP